MPYDRIDFVHPGLDLVNSQHGRGRDLLEDERWLQEYLARWGYDPAGPPSERERARLVTLRALLRRIAEALDEGKRPSAADLAHLNRALRGSSFSRELVASEAAFDLPLVPVRRDWRWVLSEIAASVADLLAGGEAARVKVCDNPDCRFAFYDVTKNRSRRWCAQTTCGNRHKVQQFRARRRALAHRGGV